MQIYNNLMIVSNTVDLTKCYDIAQALIDRYKARLEDIDARGTGALINSIDYDVVLKADAVTIVMTVLEYWYYIENGRGPTHGSGWSDPIKDLSEWIQSKIERGKFMPRPGKPLPTSLKEIHQVAYPIYLTITQKGYQRTYEKAEPLRRTLEASEDLLEQFANEVAMQIGEQVQAAWLDLNNVSKSGGATKGPKTQQIKGK